MPAPIIPSATDVIEVPFVGGPPASIRVALPTAGNGLIISVSGPATRVRFGDATVVAQSFGDGDMWLTPGVHYFKQPTSPTSTKTHAAFIGNSNVTIAGVTL